MAGSDERIEILLETVAKGQEVVPNATAGLKTLKTQAVDTSSGLSGVGEMLAKAFASFSAVAAEVTASLKEINAQVTATNAALTKKAVPVDPAIKNRAALLKEESAAQDAYSKEQAASIAATAKIEANAAKQTAEINALRIAGNREARDTDKERAASMANQAKVEIASAKQVAAEYKIINATRIAGNNEARFKEDQARASQITAGTKAALASEKEAIAAQTGYWKAYYKEQAAGAKSAATEITTAGGAFSSFSDLVQKALSTYIVYKFVGSIKDATSAVLEWMGNMETYGIAIAASLQVGGKYVEKTTGRVLEGAEAFGVAQRDAKGVIEALQVANFQTVATLDQLIRMYQEALPIAMKKGFDKKMVQEFTLSVTQAASAMGVSMDMMAEEARSLLTGAINMRNSRVAVALGITPEDVRNNSASASQLFDFLMGKLQVYRTAGEALQNSWRGVWSNFKDVMMQAGGKALEPMFEGIKAQLKSIIDSIVTLDLEAGKIIWNPEFLAGIEAIKAGITNMMNLWTVFRDAIESSTLVKAGGLVIKVVREGAGGVADAINDPMGAARTWWEKTKAGLTSGKVSTVVTEGILGIDDPWKKESYQKRDAEALKAKLKEVETIQTIARNETGLSDKELYRGMIYDLSKKYKEDPYRIAALIESESSTRNQVTIDKKGGVGAIGLGQIRSEAMQDIGIDPLSAVEPRKNIEAMIRYYQLLKANLKEATGGDAEQALLAYREGIGFVKSHWSATPKATYKEGDETITDYDKYVRGSRSVEKVQKIEADLRKSNIFGKPATAELAPSTIMTEIEKEAYKKSFDENIALLKRKEADALDIAKQAGDEKKALDKAAEAWDENLTKTKAERDQFNLRVDQETTSKQLEIKKKYLQDYTDWTDVKGKINVEGDAKLGVYKDAEEQSKATEEVKNVKAKTLREIRQLETNLRVESANEQTVLNEEDRQKAEQTAAAKVAVLQVEYDEKKKLLKLQEEFNIKPVDVSYADELEALDKLKKAQIELIKIQASRPGIGKEKAPLVAKQTQLEEELKPSEAKRLEALNKSIKADQDKQKHLEALTSAQIAYNQVIGDPTAVEALTLNLELSRLSTLAGIAQKENLFELAAAYRKTAVAVNELNEGSAMEVGFKKALASVTNEIGSYAKQWEGLFKGVAGDMKNSLSTLMFEGFKGNLNPDKERQVYDSGKKIETIQLQKEQLALDKEQISNNSALSASEKQTANAIIDAKLKQLEVDQKLAEAQKQAAENSKGTTEIWQGFLDSILKKATDFLADAAIKDLFSLLSGEETEKTKSTGKNIFSKFLGWITGAKEETKAGVQEIGVTLTDGIEAISGDIEGAGGGMVNSFSNIFGKMAEVAGGWMKSIYNTVVDYLASLVKSIAASGFGGALSSLFGDDGEANVGDGVGEGVGEGVGDGIGGFGEGLSTLAHKGGFVANMMHKGGTVFKYHGGGLTSNEVPIVAQKGEYVLSKEDVDFVKKVKSTGPTTITNINVQGGGGGGSSRPPTIVPLGVTVMMDNQSSAMLQASAKARQSKDEQQYIIDVVLSNINSRGSLGGWR